MVGQAQSVPGSAGNPLVGGTTGSNAAGLDAKVGLTSNFTLDATVNPDFGQVEADPSVVNLTAYETFFEEKRPFFLEGKRILTLGLAGSAIAGDESGTLQGDQLFYSRRIGAPPSIQPAVPAGAFVDAPGETSIISAVKVTGKTRNGLSVGLLQSVTGNEYADVWSNAVTSRVQVAPTTNYAVGRMQKDWDSGNTILGGMFTSTHRWLPGGDALKRLPSDAFTGAVDATHFFANRSYVVEGKGVFSRIAGDASAIRALETDPVHYYQRPDANRLGANRNATSMLGHAGTVRVARYGNSKWPWSESARWISPGLDLNDVGYLRQADAILNEARLEFNEIEPRGAFRSYGFAVSRDDAWDFGGLKTAGSTGFEANGAFRNLWGISGSVNVNEAPTDTRLLRGGPAMTTSGYVSAEVGVHSDTSRRLSARVSTGRHFLMDGGGSRAQVTTQVDVRPIDAVNFSANVFYEHNVDDLQYVDTVSPAPGGAVRYLLGHLHQNTLGLTFRANVFITPELTIQYYGSPFVSNGAYGGFKRVTTPRAGNYADRFSAFTAQAITYVPAFNAYRVSDGGVTYGFDNPDFEFRQFRSNLVGRWEFRPGSTLYVVWSQDRTGEQVLGQSLTSSLDTLRLTPATNVFLVKLSYWFGL